MRRSWSHICPMCAGIQPRDQGRFAKSTRPHIQNLPKCGNPIVVIVAIGVLLWRNKPITPFTINQSSVFLTRNNIDVVRDTHAKPVKKAVFQTPTVARMYNR